MLPFAFRILGSLWERRRLVNADVAFQAYAQCDAKAEVEREAYLSAFRFGDEFRQLLEATGSTKGYCGDCWAQWLWFDVDRENDLNGALTDARRLAGTILDRYRALDEDDLLPFFSGSKGFHVGVPTAIWESEPSNSFHRAARLVAERCAERAKVEIDVGVYDRVRAFRAPNSRHPKTGLYKRHFSVAELAGLSLGAILAMAREPIQFDIPTPKRHDDQAIADWVDAVHQVEREAVAKSQRCAVAANGVPSLNRLTLAFIRNGAIIGDQHRLLFPPP